MFRFGLRLSLQGGREVATRLALMTISVIVGVAMILFTLAGLHAVQATYNRPCWECTTVANPKSLQGNIKPSVNEATSDPLLWSYNEDFFKGKNLERLNVAALGPKAPIPPGIPKNPNAGQYYASPALIKLLQTTPSNELGDRFPGKLIGTIGSTALSSPNELVAMVGQSPAELQKSPRTITVHSIETAPQPHTIVVFLKVVIAIGAAGLLFPMFILIGTATRLSAARREERFAALRLVGATPRQISIMASADALVSAVIGTLGGLILYFTLRPVVAGSAISGAPFFVRDLTPNLGGYVAILLGVPIIAVAASIFSLRRLQISPLGVARHTTPKPPRFRRAIPLFTGLIMFTGILLYGKSHNNVGGWIVVPFLIGFVLIMLGIVVAGPWITMALTKLFSRRTRKAHTLLAARRLADNPKAAFRSVSGLVLAVFVGTVFSSLAPAILAGPHISKTDNINDTLTAMFFDSETAGLNSEDSANLITQIKKNQVKVVPVYSLLPTVTVDRNASQGVISCQDFNQISSFGTCASGQKYQVVNTFSMLRDPSYTTTASATGVSPNVSTHPLQAILVEVGNHPDTIEKIRTTLATYPRTTQLPETYGEIKSSRLATINALQRMVYVGITITLLVASCSLAVAVGGGLVERKRPFTLLRLAGTPSSTLKKVVLIEAMVPLVFVAIVSALIGYFVTVIVVKVVAISGTPLKSPALGYYVTMAGGLAFSFLIVSAILPLLSRITNPDNVRFE